MSGGNDNWGYDDEDRLIQIADNVYMTFMSQFTYDGLGRLRIRDEFLSQYDPNAGSNVWYQASETRYVYDGWRVIQEWNWGNGPAVGYTRGTDLSGSLEGAGLPRQSEATAGGIGGLLARSDLGAGTHAYYHADGSGNITMLLDANQSMVASYRYNDPYGNNVTASGTLAGANLYRFSSKEFHVNSGLYYYGYRFYFPYPQRWINRDPIWEPGFELLARRPANPISSEANLYCFVGNEPTVGIDAVGLLSYRYRKCNADEALVCGAKCIQTGVKSCTVTEIWDTGPDGQPIRLFYDMDCECNPPRKKIPWTGIIVGVCVSIIIVL